MVRLVPGLFCPRFLASRSLYLQAEQSNHIVKLKELHLQPRLISQRL